MKTTLYVMLATLVMLATQAQAGRLARGPGGPEKSCEIRATVFVVPGEVGGHFDAVLVAGEARISGRALVWSVDGKRARSGDLVDVTFPGTVEVRLASPGYQRGNGLRAIVHRCREAVLIASVGIADVGL